MINHIFGSTGVAVATIGQGSWQFPSDHKAVEETKEALSVGIEQGMAHIDTAEMYGNAELIIAEAIKDLPRQSLFIVSKVLPQNASYAGTMAACERSLKRLRTDYLDCYLLHWRGNIPLSETMAALEKLVDDGKARSLGVSNFDVGDLKEADALLSKHKIVCNQVLYNLYERGIERNLIPYCASNNIALVGYTPFGQRKIPASSTKSGAILQAIADKHHATPRQVILAFLVRFEHLFTIPKASQERHTLENARAGDLKLDQDDVDKINEAFPVPTRDSPLAMI